MMGIEGSTYGQGWVSPANNNYSGASNAAGSGLGGMSVAAMFIPALTSLLGAGSAAADIKAQNKVILANIDSESKSMNFSLRQKNEQMKDLDRAVGDKLSENGFNAMVTEARLRTASAETGASGTVSQEVTASADVQRMHNDAIILRESDLAKQSLMTSSAAEILNFSNRATSIRSSQRSSASAGLNVLNAGIGGFTSGLSFLNTSQREDLFGINTTGER